MRSELEVRSPNQGTGWADSWTFSGRDESTLRDCLAHLDAYLTPAPIEHWNPKKHRRVIEAEDRWRAAMLLFTNEEYDRQHAPEIQAERAWTVDGALHLAELLPDDLADVRDGIQRRFRTDSD